MLGRGRTQQYNSNMADPRRNICSPLALSSVLLLLASCAPLLSPAFMLSTSFPPRNRVSSCFQRQARTAASATERRCASGASGTHRHAYSRARSHHTTTTTARGWQASTRPPSRTAATTTMMSALSATLGSATATSASALFHERPTVELQQDRCRGAMNTLASRNAASTPMRGRRRTTALGARGGGRSGGDSSRRRTDRPDEYSAERKKGKGRGGRGGRSGGRGGRSSGSSSEGIGAGTGAPSPFEPATDGAELWGGESRLSSLDDRAPAEFSRKIDCSELSRKPK